ncbi:MAG: hypothetical protein P8Q95_04310 [Candidatus Poseidoniaceae archaeon]|nr:hypothetical protein [Candidatus Poseidoniaceae archaeon]
MATMWPSKWFNSIMIELIYQVVSKVNHKLAVVYRVKKSIRKSVGLFMASLEQVHR